MESKQIAEKKIRTSIPKRLIVYDGCILIFIQLLSLCIPTYRSSFHTVGMFILHVAISVAIMYIERFAGQIYNSVLRYANIGYYLRFLISDILGGCVYYLINRWMSLKGLDAITFMTTVFIMESNMLISMFIRIVYSHVYQTGFENNRYGRFMTWLYLLLTGSHKANSVESLLNAPTENKNVVRKTNILIIGAGRIGAMLAGELLENPKAIYRPMYFVDIDTIKIGRKIYNLNILGEDEIDAQLLDEAHIHEAVIAVANISFEKKKELYEHYTKLGLIVKLYDYPTMQSMQGGKRQLRNFEIEELLFRKHKVFLNAETREFYQDKVVLISGGGGSIGSELCRQIAGMRPKRIIVLDEYENGAYEIQQELRQIYGNTLDLRIEIVTVCDKLALQHVFAKYHPNIVLHAAAHKHVPLMETNCIEAVRNNVFGTLNIVETAKEYAVQKFIMISTDKAVNPTNVMGATKRMCEMIVLNSHSAKTNFSATRFGNVLGSNGSVIPLFQKQIANGGPVTITDKRIIRYFMTIPEAAQLVLTSGAMAAQSELYVLDMGRPVKIYDLAVNMIRLSGYTPDIDIKIVETGLRPGEKLYEELLIQSETLSKTQNEMIYVEKDTPLTHEEIEQKLEILRKALDTNDDDAVREALKEVVPTYHSPETVNAQVANDMENQSKQVVAV